jgi:hypothetical protein
VDLHGDGRLVPDPGKAAKLIPQVKGLQTVTFEVVPGMEAALARRAVCRAHDGPEPRIAWTSETFDTVQNTNHIIADVDADGQLDVVLAPHYRVLILDGATGRTKHVLRFHSLRNYGFFCASNLDDDPRLELIVVADFALHLDVIDMDAKGPNLLWRKDIEADIQSKRRILAPGPDPVADLDGDGRKEIIVNLYNDSNDQLWHVVAFDALTGAKRLDLPRRFMAGHGDLDGDGREELLLCECPALYVPLAGSLSVVSWDPRDEPVTRTRWSSRGGRFLLREAPLPLTHSTIVARGTETAATVKLGGGGGPGFLVAAPEGSGERISLISLSVERPLLSLSLPAPGSIRGIFDADEDNPAAFAISFPARSSARIEIPAARGGDLDAVSARPVPPRRVRGSQADGWVATGSWGGKPAVFTDNALGEVVALEPPRKPGGELNVAWRDAGQGPLILADLDGDGAAEAIFADESPTGEGRILAAAPTGRKWVRPLDGFPGPHPPWNWGGITEWWVGRFTSRTRFDVWASARRGTMHSDEGFALSGKDGALLWQRSEVRTPDLPPTTRGWGCGGGSLNAADIDGDGLDDVVSLYPVNYWVCRGTDGELLKSVSAASGLFEGVWGAYATPCVADLDRDGKPQVFWSGPYHQGVTDSSGKARWRHKGGSSLVTLLDMDGDGALEAASTGWEKDGAGLRVLNARTGALRWEMPLEGNPRADVIAAQLDGTPGEELLFPIGKTLHAVTWRDGALHELWRIDLPAEPMGELAFADADGDSHGEILFAGKDGALYCFK